MKKFILFIIVVLVLFFGYRWMSSPALEEAETTPLPTVIIDGENDVQPVQVGNAGMAEEENANIRLSSPTANSTVASPIHVVGETDASLSMLRVRVKNTKGETLIEEAVRVRKGVEGARGTFEVNIHFQFSSTKEGVIEVSAEQGADSVSVPVKFE